MKRFSYLLAALLLVAPAAFGKPGDPPAAEPNPGNIEVVQLFLGDVGKSEPTIPGRPILRAPGRGSHRPAQPQASMTLQFETNLGVASVEIANQTTGEFSQTYVDTSIGFADLFYSGNPGFWSVRVLLLESGQTCSWTFVIQ